MRVLHDAEISIDIFHGVLVGSLVQHSLRHKRLVAMPTPSEGRSPSEALSAFCKLLEGDLDLQSRVKAAETPKQIIDIAGSIGHQISYVELRVWSRELSADYFPWATMGHEWRRNFFKRKG